MIPNHSNDDLRKKIPLIEKYSTSWKSYKFSIEIF
jgi:hypothetical protein